MVLLLCELLTTEEHKANPKTVKAYSISLVPRPDQYGYSIKYTVVSTFEVISLHMTWAADSVCNVSRGRARGKSQKGRTQHYLLSNICMCAHKEEGRASSLADTWDFFIT